MAKSHRMRPLGTGIALVFAALTLTACGGGEPARDASGKVTASSDANIFALKVGDCVEVGSDQDNEVASMPVVPCDKPHTGEVFAETTLTGDEYPGLEETKQKAEDFCRTEFATFIGVDYDNSEYDMRPIYPVESGWTKRDDRTVQCIVSGQGDLTGTLKDAKK